MQQRRRQVPWQPDFAWSSPLFSPLRPVATAFRDHVEFPSPEAIDLALAEAAGVRFVRSEPPPARQGRIRRESDLYDANIHDRQRVPTRPGSWHDFLNALVWCLFPRAKFALHARQHHLVARGLDGSTGKLPGARTREQDALALFDEGGLAVWSPAPLATGEEIEAAMAEGTARGIVFGHAIYESYVLGAPWPTVRAIVVADQDLDAGVAAVLDDVSRITEPAELPRVKITPLLRDDSQPSSTSP